MVAHMTLKETLIQDRGCKKNELGGRVNYNSILPLYSDI